MISDVGTGILKYRYWCFLTKLLDWCEADLLACSVTYSWRVCCAGVLLFRHWEAVEDAAPGLFTSRVLEEC